MPPKKKAPAPVEGSEVEMGGIMLRAVKNQKGEIVWKSVAEIEKAAAVKAQPKPKSDKDWLREKERAVVNARQKEHSADRRAQQSRNAKTYGASEFYTKRNDKQSQVQVPVSKYLADLRLEEEQARTAQMHTKNPGGYRFIKEALDVEEDKYRKQVAKARERAYEQTRRRMGVRGGKKSTGDSSDEEDDQNLSEEEFRRLCQARNESAKKEVERRGGKVVAPSREECEVSTRAEQSSKGNGSRIRERTEFESQASVGYVDPRSMQAQEQAADEFSMYQTLKEVSEQQALSRDKGDNQHGKGKGNRNNRNNRRRNDGKGKGKGKGGGGKGGGNKRQSNQSDKVPKP